LVRCLRMLPFLITPWSNTAISFTSNDFSSLQAHSGYLALYQNSTTSSSTTASDVNFPCVEPRILDLTRLDLQLLPDYIHIFTPHDRVFFDFYPYVNHILHIHTCTLSFSLSLTHIHCPKDSLFIFFLPFFLSAGRSVSFSLTLSQTFIVTRTAFSSFSFLSFCP